MPVSSASGASASSSSMRIRITSASRIFAALASSLLRPSAASRIAAVLAREPGMAAGESVFRHTLRTSTEFKNYFGNAKLQGPWLASGPLRAGSRPLHRDGIFAAGNAAGEVHPLIGSGISMAMRSASILSPLLDAALRGEMTMDAAARAYEMQWRTEFARRLFLSSCFVRLVGRASPARLVAHAPWLLTLAAKVSS